MAKWVAPIVLLTSLFALAGCQPSAGKSSVVESLPPPNFSGPSFPEQVAPRSVAPVAPTPPPAVAIAPTPQRITPHHAPWSVPADWIPNAAPNQWYWIVVHHSATPTGGAVAFDKEHRQKGWDELGYHFVIGNGTDTRDGQIEVGSRWRKQKWGAHAKTPDNRFNEHGIGICLVGNFDITRPSARQLDSLARLIAYLQSTYHISSDHVVGHGTVHILANGGTVTDCPGRHLSIAQVRRMSAQVLAAAGKSIPLGQTEYAHASTELLHETKRR
jgi:hypothetical protein